HFA
ncbi:hypothetical protein BVZ80_01043B, partial [Haemophilus influenzae]